MNDKKELIFHKDEPSLEILEKKFYGGQINETREELRKIEKTDPNNPLVNRLLGQSALLKNKFDEAEDFLVKAHNLDFEDKKTLEQLAQLYYRQDNFEKSAYYFEKLNKSILARKLNLLKDKDVYQLLGDKRETEIKLEQVDPLPLLKVNINGKEATFFIDTGAWEIIIDNEFALEIGIEDVGSTQGIFAGGKQAAVGHGVCDSFVIGDFTIKNLPVSLMPTRRMSPIFGGKEVLGIIGTAFFYHFITTLDYRKGKLLLQTRCEENYKTLENRIMEKKPHIIPFWLSGTHFILAWGKIENSRDILFFVDTGLAGGGLTCSKKLIEEIGIEVDYTNTKTGLGGGGKIQIVPFQAKEISLGTATNYNIPGFIKPDVPTKIHEMNVEGIISHAFFKPFSLTFDFNSMNLLLF